MFSPHTVRGHVSQCKASHFALLPVAPRKQNGCVSAQPAAGQQQELRQNISQEILLKLVAPAVPQRCHIHTVIMRLCKVFSATGDL